MGREDNPSALSAALDRLDECTSVQQLIKTSAQLADIFINNDVALEFLKEQAVYILERIEHGCNPEMSIELFRQLMKKGTIADA
jgi:spermidine/putrescine-binding protein